MNDWLSWNERLTSSAHDLCNHAEWKYYESRFKQETEPKNDSVDFTKQCQIDISHFETCIMNASGARERHAGN